MEGGAEPLRQDGELLGVDLRARVEHDEEDQQQRDQVGVGDEPALVTLRLLGFFAPHAASGFSAAARASSAAGSPRSRGGRKPSSFSRTMRGLSPAWMARIPWS